MIRFIKEHPQYYTLYLLLGFFLFVIAWFSFKGPSVQQNTRSTSTRTTASAASLGEKFEPSATNVTRSAAQQLESLRLRVAQSPEDTTHVVRLARMLRDAHQVDEAATYYNQYLEQRPANRQAWLDLSQSLGEMNRWEEAEKATESLLKYYPNDPSGLYNLGAIYANQARIEEAKQIWITVASQTIDAQMAELASSSLERLKSFLKP